MCNRTVHLNRQTFSNWEPTSTAKCTQALFRRRILFGALNRCITCLNLHDGQLAKSKSLFAINPLPEQPLRFCVEKVVPRTHRSRPSGKSQSKVSRDLVPKTSKAPQNFYKACRFRQMFLKAKFLAPTGVDTAEIRPDENVRKHFERPFWGGEPRSLFLRPSRAGRP